MIFVVDKNTNRIIYATEAGPYLLDEYTYRFDAPAKHFAFPLWDYRITGGRITYVEPAQTAK